MRVFPDIHRVDGVTCNVYLIDEPDGLTLIDAGLPGAWKRILPAIQAIGRSPSDVRHILITHQHLDHVGSLFQLAQATGAETWAHPIDTPAIEGRGPREIASGLPGAAMRLAILPRTRPNPITHQVRGGATIPVLTGEGGLQVVETFGHTMGHISFYLPGRKLLIAGDAVSSSRGRLVPPPSMFNKDTAMALESMRHLATLDIDACLTGHGGPVLSGARALIAAGAGAPATSWV